MAHHDIKGSVDEGSECWLKYRPRIKLSNSENKPETEKGTLPRIDKALSMDNLLPEAVCGGPARYSIIIPHQIKLSSANEPRDRLQKPRQAMQ